MKKKLVAVSTNSKVNIADMQFVTTIIYLHLQVLQTANKSLYTSGY